jgi:hypothetical protein
VSAPEARARAISILDRLKRVAQRDGRPAAELLEFYGIERFLHRLGRSAHRDRLVLKGALLTREWLGTRTRPTRDIDLLSPEDLSSEMLRAAIVEILRGEVEEDGIAFDLDSIEVQPIRLGSSVLGLRVRFNAHMDRTRLRYQVDVGLGDSVYPAPVETVPASLPGLPVASLRVVRGIRRFVEPVIEAAQRGIDFASLWNPVDEAGWVPSQRG